MTEKTVDRWFSKFIRLRDSSLEFGEFDGRGSEMLAGDCCTCGKIVRIWDLENGWNPSAHCGHFIGRYFKSTRYDEQNCHLQCQKCNTFAEGKQFEHGLFIDKKYGAGTAEKILIKSKQLCKRNRNDLKWLSDHYRKKAQELAKQKGIKL